MKPEIWKQIPNFEGFYEASNYGRIRNSITKIILKADGKGYPKVVLCKKRKRYNFRVHEIICRTFHGPKPSTDHEVNHKDGVKRNIKSENVEWSLHGENIQHALVHGLIKTGSKSKLAKRYIITSPTGFVYKVKGLRYFCRKHGLAAGNMSSLATGRVKTTSYKGWRCVYA